MKIEHVALWAKDIDALKDFYIKYFEAKSNDKYLNIKTGFSSYFLKFDQDARLEIMNRKDLEERLEHQIGYAHIAFSLGSKERVVNLTERLRQDGYTILSEPRTTGDGYFESVILDPEGNKIELTM